MFRNNKSHETKHIAVINLIFRGLVYNNTVTIKHVFIDKLFLHQQSSYLPLEVLDGTACDNIFIKLQLKFLICSALHTHGALGHFLVRRSLHQSSAIITKYVKKTDDRIHFYSRCATAAA